MIKNLISKAKVLNQSNKFNFSSLVIGETKDGKLNKSLYKIINAASQLNEETHLLLTGSNVSGALENIQSTVSNKFISKILVAEADHLNGNTADRVDQIVSKLIKDNGYSQVIADASSFGKDVIPRVAAQFDSQPVTDIIEIIENNTFKRPVYAGNAIATVKSNADIKFLTFRPTSFEEISQEGVEKIEAVEQVDATLSRTDNLTTFVKEDLVKSDRPELGSARIVISGGRGLKNGENFGMLEKLGDAFGDAAIGASRAAVDAGYVSNDLQVGQTGKVVAPELYLAVGISGAIQHVAGMKDSKVIVAINKDEDAPIFEIATYGLVGDLFKIIPELTEKLEAAK